MEGASRIKAANSYSNPFSQHFCPIVYDPWWGELRTEVKRPVQGHQGAGWGPREVIEGGAWNRKERRLGAERLVLGCRGMRCLSPCCPLLSAADVLP